MTRSTRALFLIAVSFLLSGCYRPAEIAEELQFAREKPHESDLVGKWIPTSATLEDMRKHGGYAISTHELVLNADKTFSMANMPDWWASDFGESKGAFQSASGRWSLSLATGGEDWRVDLTVGTAGIGFLHVRNQKPPYLIHIGVGDPDSGHFMLFERSSRSRENAHRRSGFRPNRPSRTSTVTTHIGR